MLFCILFFIIISLILRLPAEKWRHPYIVSAFIVFIIFSFAHSCVDGVLVLLWYVFLISDYGKLFMKNETFDGTAGCAVYITPTANSNVTATQITTDPRKTMWDNTYANYTTASANAFFDPELQNQLNSVYSANVNDSKYFYNNNTDNFPVTL